MWWKKTIKLVGAAYRPRFFKPVGAGGPLLTALVAVASLEIAARADTVPAPARDWQWIIIHHSATRTGNAEVFDGAHRARGMINGLAYHFVIDNGTDGKVDGFIESGARWIKQMHGGHCRQAYINEQGIGICLVGDFSRDKPTPRQLDSLVLLVRGLQEQFHIPNDHVLGHGEVVGEFSECPGRLFPWEEFWKRLNDKPLAQASPPVATDPPDLLPARRNFVDRARSASPTR